MTLRDTITAAQQTGPVALDCAALGGQRVWIKVLSGFEVNAYFISCEKKSAGQIQQMLVQRCLCDETGAAVFAPNEIAEVAKLDNRFLEEVATFAQRVNCLATRDVEAMRAGFFGSRVDSGCLTLPATSAGSTPTSSSAKSDPNS